MKSILLLPLLTALTAHGFVPLAPPPAHTELNALGLRTAKNFISRRILRRKPKVVMRDDEDSAVKDGRPLVTADDKGSADPYSKFTTPVTMAKLEEEEEEMAPRMSDVSLAETVDNFFAASKPQQAKDLLLKQFAAGVDVETSGPLYWRLVKAHYELFLNTEDPKLQQDYLEQGLALVDTVCPSIVDEDVTQTTQAFLLKWKAILLGKLGNFQTTKEKMANSFIIKDSLEEAQALLIVKNKEDSSIYQALGEWCFKVANISFLERQVASVLFGQPPKATYEEALEYFQKGYDLKATASLTRKLAETHEKMGQSTQANAWFAKAEDLESVVA